ncbi:hypothetical protein O181_116830 [Austropuccinia psidii MF-1]|uniref:Uncharacterized protein n=1 Tax=Austropuccinia psidii MF-1 TaxID=1389203 RepID=A0A9Q3PXU6_9BASI|nr:hypothetical protein [Austropuccinia psidii MF-1]
MQAQEFKASEQCTSSLKVPSREWGHNLIMAPQSPQYRASRPSWAPIIHPGPPLQLLEGHVLDGTGPSPWAQAL